MHVLLKCASLLLLVGACAGQAADGRLQIDLYVTAGCTDTVWFIQNQLNPVLEEFGGMLDVTVVPWGRATRNEDGDVVCQFFAPDCWANRAQRCALSLLPSQEARLHYIDCEYRANTDRPAFLQGSYLCALASGVNLVSLDYCVATGAGDAVEAAAEAASAQPIQVIDFVPAIVIGGGVPQEAASMSAFTGLRAVVCNALLLDPSTDITSC